MASWSIPRERRRNDNFLRRLLAKFLIGPTFRALLILFALLIFSTSFISRSPILRGAASWQQQYDSLTLEKLATEPARAIPLSQLTGAARSYSCGNGLVFIADTIHTMNRYYAQPNATERGASPTDPDEYHQAIPKVIHQTSKSRCVTPKFYQAIQQWRSWAPGYEHYFHDDTAILSLLRRESVDFPILNEIVRFCIRHGTLRSDLWRYLVLFVYGGIYVDIDAVPEKLVSQMLHQTTGVFMVEQYHLLSQYFMAVTPRHPLMWYAIQVSILQLSSVSDTGSAPTALVTGPHALHKAFIEFSRDAGEVIAPAGVGQKPIKAGTYTGTWNYTIRAYGNASNQNEWVNRDIFSGQDKRRDYRRMGMRHFSEDKLYPSGKSCLSAVLHGSIQFNMAPPDRLEQTVRHRDQ